MFLSCSYNRPGRTYSPLPLPWCSVSVPAKASDETTPTNWVPKERQDFLDRKVQKEENSHHILQTRVCVQTEKQEGGLLRPLRHREKHVKVTAREREKLNQGKSLLPLGNLWASIPSYILMAVVRRHKLYISCKHTPCAHIAAVVRQKHASRAALPSTEQERVDEKTSTACPFMALRKFRGCIAARNIFSPPFSVHCRALWKNNHNPNSQRDRKTRYEHVIKELRLCLSTQLNPFARFLYNQTQSTEFTCYWLLSFSLLSFS